MCSGCTNNKIIIEDAQIQRKRMGYNLVPTYGTHFVTTKIQRDQNGLEGTDQSA